MIPLNPMDMFRMVWQLPGWDTFAKRTMCWLMTYKCPLKKIVHDLFEGILNPLNNIQIKKNALMSNSMAETSYHQPPPKKSRNYRAKIFTLGSPIWKSPLALFCEQLVGWLALFGWNSTHLCFLIAQDLFIKPNLKKLPIQEFFSNVFHGFLGMEKTTSCKLFLFPQKNHGTEWASFGKTRGPGAPAGCFIHLPAATGHCRATSLRVFKSKIGSLEAISSRWPHILWANFLFLQMVVILSKGIPTNMALHSDFKIFKTIQPWSLTTCSWKGWLEDKPLPLG